MVEGGLRGRVELAHRDAPGRGLAQARIAVSMLRLSDPAETQLNLGPDAARTIGSCVLLVGLTERSSDDQLGPVVAAFIETAGGTRLPNDDYGTRWAATRFFAPYLRDSLWERGYAVDTVETATEWSRVAATRSVVEEALRLLIQTRGQSSLRRLRGQVAWNGDLDTSRLARQAK